MNALAWVKATGVVVALTSEGGLELDGLEHLDDELYGRVLDVARAYKTEIVKQLQGQPDIEPEPPVLCRKWITPAQVENFKAARPWLLGHLDALLAAGWTRDELFRIKRPLGHPYSWGVAWGSGWREADHVALNENGWIAYHYRQPHGRMNVTHSWPKRYRHGAIVT